MLGPDKEVTLSDCLDYLDYIVNLVGVDHVGIGSNMHDTMRVLPIRLSFEVDIVIC